MIVYHGSYSRFKQLRISKSLVKHTSTELNEGIGIYFSTDREVAKSYGKYIYTLEINDTYLCKFNTIIQCKKYLGEMIKYASKSSGVDLYSLISQQVFEHTVRYMYCGGIMLCELHREIMLLLDSVEQFHLLSENKHNKIRSALKKFNKDTLKVYTFNYSIKNIGVIKDVDNSVVRIISIEDRDS